MKSRATIGGHPIHPILVTVPIGLFLWTFVADVVYVLRDHEAPWYDIAFWSGIAAVVSGATAALFGLIDGLTVAWQSDAREKAIAHGSLNTAVMALYLAAIIMMMDNGAVEGRDLGIVVALHAAGVGLLLLSGWLGGEMVFRHHLGVIPEDAEAEQEQKERHAAPRGVPHARSR